jgi:hypothetical protein
MCVNCNSQFNKHAQAVKVLEGAKRALKLARRELGEFRRDREALRLRDACEKGWLAVLMATDALLAEFGLGKPESYAERRMLLKKLEVRVTKAVELGLRNRLGARGYYLHILGYHEGSLVEEEVEEELNKVEEYLEYVEELLEGSNHTRLEG